MNKIFNTELEISLRVLLISYILKNKKINIERWVAYDIMATYGKKFKISDENLHGNNEFIFSEFPNRKLNIENVVCKLIAIGIIEINNDENNITYIFTEKGRYIVNNMKSQYVEEYCQNIEKVIRKYGNLNDAQLIELVLT